MDNKAQQSPSLDKKKISVSRIKVLEGTLGFASNPNMADWDRAEIVGEGGEELLSALKAYRKSFQELNEVWFKLHGEKLK